MNTKTLDAFSGASITFKTIMTNESILSDDWEIVEEKPLPAKTKTVWQWRFKGNHDWTKYNWCVYEKLLTEDEALMTLNCYKYEKHLGPYEVSIE